MLAEIMIFHLIFRNREEERSSLIYFSDVCLPFLNLWAIDSLGILVSKTGGVGMEYDPFYGTPTHWQNSSSEDLRVAVRDFIDHAIDKRNPFSDREFALVRQYGIEYLAAPCWGWAAEEVEYPQGKVEIAYLRELIAKATTAQDIAEWLRRCMRSM